MVLSLTIDENLFMDYEYLSSRFNCINCVFFDSYKSIRDENSGHVNAGNISSKLLQNEVLMPNNALYHRQVCIFAEDLQSNSIAMKSPPAASVSNKILQVNAVPNLGFTVLSSDLSFFDDSFDLSSYSLCIFSSLLYCDLRAMDLIMSFTSVGLSPISLSPNLPLPSENSRILLIGFETHWSPDSCNDRLYLNRIRSDSSLSFTFAIVESRFSLTCSASLLSHDH